jgi:hypothetical protein
VGEQSNVARGTQYELFVLQVLKRFRFRIERTGRAGDGSYDLFWFILAKYLANHVAGLWQ